MLKSKIYLLLSLLVIISACSQKKLAPVLLKGENKYYKNNLSNYSYSSAKKSNINVFQNSRKYKEQSFNKSLASSKKSDLVLVEDGEIIVMEGDNLYGIAQNHHVSVRDLIDANNLEPPYILKVGSKLILPNTKYHTVAEGDNLYKISRAYNMNVNELIDLNNLQEPYNIVIGSKLKVSNVPVALASTEKVEEGNLNFADTNTNLRSVNESNAASIAEAKLPYKDNKFIWPVTGKIISNFGPKSGGLYNDGINIKAPESSPVKAVEDGMVAYVGNELRGYGNLVILKHAGGWISAYAHLKETRVKIGTKVKQGENIALVGSTGNADSPQLYFGMRKGREAVNPQTYLN